MIQPRRIYGSRYKPLTASRKVALRHLNEFEIALDGVAAGELHPKNFRSPAPALCHLEIGFGTGEHLAHLAAQHPDDIFLAAEPFIAGVSQLIKMMMQEDIQNICIYPNDGLALLQALATQTVDHAYVLFPDPWPKQRHHVRRFLQTETLDELARVIVPGGDLLLATDDPGMLTWMQKLMAQRTDFTPQSHRHEPPLGHRHSRYAQKAREAEKPLHYLTFARQ